MPSHNRATRAQGQTLQRSGVLLDEPVYTHGQLHVASSRCGDPGSIRFLYRMVRLQTSSTQKCCHVDTHLCGMCHTLIPYSVQKTVVSELPVVALFDVQTYRDCKIYMWIIWHFCTFRLSHSREPQPRVAQLWLVLLII